MRINNNSTAFNVWTNHSTNFTAAKNSMNKMASGVISVVNDPAGIGISERMRSQIKSASMAIRNTESAISMNQTADGYLQQIGDQLSRMKALAVKSNGIMSSNDTANVNTEFKALQSEISRITSSSSAAGKFNGLYLFRGGNGVPVNDGDGVEQGTISVQIGSDDNQTIDMALENLESDNSEVIGTVTTYTYDDDNQVTETHQTDVTWQDVMSMDVTSPEAVGMLDKAIDFVANARAETGATQSRFEQAREGLMAYESNIRESESSIRDVDMAKESTILARQMILLKASNAMMTQANALPGLALSLI